jgi:hypothetical protein
MEHHTILTNLDYKHGIQTTAFLELLSMNMRSLSTYNMNILCDKLKIPHCIGGEYTF